MDVNDSKVGKEEVQSESQPLKTEDELVVTPTKKAIPWLLTFRVTLAMLSSWGFLIMYATKVNLSVAIVCMVNHSAVIDGQSGSLKMEEYNYSTSYDNSTNITGVTVNLDTDVYHEQSCSLGDLSGVQAENGEFTWDKNIQNIVLGSLFYGYILTQIPGGWLAGKFGGKRIFGWFMFLCVVATLLTPVAARVHYGFLICLRVLVGVGQGVVWPAMHAIWAFWAPPEERSRLIGFTIAGAQIGNVIAFPLAGLLCKYGFDGGWPSVFYVLGIFGFLWFLAWMFLVSDTPNQHPRITDYEKNYIQHSLKGAMKKNIENTAVPWVAIAKSPAVWALVVTHTCANWVSYTFLTNMPAYMKEVLKFDIKSNGLLSAVPYIGMWCFIIISGIVSDWLTKSKRLTVTQARKLFCTLGEFVPAAILVSLGFIDCTLSYVAVLLLTLAISFSGCAYSAGYMVNSADIAPKYSSIVFGISNTAATIPGFLAPFTVGQLTPNKTQEEWRLVFYLAAAICIFGNIFYLIFGSGELQDWAKEKEGDVNKELTLELQVKGLLKEAVA